MKCYFCHKDMFDFDQPSGQCFVCNNCPQKVYQIKHSGSVSVMIDINNPDYRIDINLESKIASFLFFPFGKYKLPNGSSVIPCHFITKMEAKGLSPSNAQQWVNRIDSLKAFL